MRCSTAATRLPVESVVMPVLSCTDLVIARVSAISEHACDFEPALRTVRALREQVDWAQCRSAFEGKPFGETFLYLCTALDVIPPTSLRRGRRARDRVSTTYDHRRIERMLAEDDDVAELGIRLSEVAGAVVVQGCVASEERRERVLARVREFMPETDVVSEIRVTEDEVEDVPIRAEVIE